MNFWSYLFETLSIVFIYIFIYNISLFIFFWNFHQFLSTHFKTIYSFSNFKFNFFFLFSFTITLLSLAGIPPFFGFFSKLLIIISLSSSNFSIFFFFFFSLLFIGLYFYIQNIRFLNSNTSNKINYIHEKTIKISTTYFLISFLIIFILIIGPVFIDDLFFYFYWIFK